MHLANTNIVNIESRPTIYESTNDKNHIQQYAKLLKHQYKKELNLNIADLATERLNTFEKTFVIRLGNKVIGGAKLYLSFDQYKYLPMESDKFLTTTLFPADCKNPARAEIGRLVLDPEFRGGQHIYRIISLITQTAIEHGCSHLFVLAPPLNAILYRRVCSALGMPAKIRKDVTVPVKAEYKDLGLRLLSCDIRNMNPATSTPDSLEIAV